MDKLIDVRCPLAHPTNPKKDCNKLCVRVTAGSAGEAFCPRHEKVFEFHVDDQKSFNATMSREKPIQSDKIANAEHPAI